MVVPQCDIHVLPADEMYEILSNLPESVAYTCINCTEQHPAEWRLALGKELQLSLKQVLTALLNSRTTSHLMRYRQVSLSLGAAQPLCRERDFRSCRARQRHFRTILVRVSMHVCIVVCLQAAKPPDLNPETEESVPSRSSPEGPDPPVLTEVSKQEEQQPLDLESVKRKMDQGGYTSVVRCAPTAGLGAAFACLAAGERRLNGNFYA